ncbi:MAG: hypothetical protein RLZZ297_1694 [Chloroflexota bacterium]|jgi:L-seryl-tRNA(Ser) seleniumtransferase
MNPPPHPFRILPSVDALVAAAHPHTAAPRSLITTIAREVLAACRAQAEPLPLAGCVDRVVAQLDTLLQPTLRPVLNGTGVLLQTNLGRAPLSAAARAAMAAASGAASVEYDLARGARGDRHSHLSPLLTTLTGAEAALAVNNTAAAVLLILSAFAAGCEVIVSRGEAVEIGGGFRIPDVLRQSGATLVEVGTTNRTYVRDYAAAITDKTALVLCVHPSNFRQTGFVHRPERHELAALAHERGLLLVDDIGSGSLRDVTPYGLAAEPLVQDHIAAGADIVCFSGDKLLGGPQAGLIVGRRTLVERLATHPLLRALRLDKTALAGLHATLLSYVMQTAERDIPIWQMLAAPLDTLAHRAQALCSALGAPWQVRPCQSAVGGGALPGAVLPSWALVLPAPQADRVAARARAHDTVLVGRVADDAFWVDLRTIAPEDDTALQRICSTLTTDFS